MLGRLLGEGGGLLAAGLLRRLLGRQLQVLWESPRKAPGGLQEDPKKSTGRPPKGAKTDGTKSADLSGDFLRSGRVGPGRAGSGRAGPGSEFTADTTIEPLRGKKDTEKPRQRRGELLKAIRKTEANWNGNCTQNAPKRFQK